jgi:uncharacterized protein (TIGR02246 family)
LKKKSIAPLFIVLTFALLLSGACTTAAIRHDDRADIIAAMHRYDEALLGPVEATVAMYAPNGELLLPGMAALHGPEAIRAFLAPLAAAVKVESVTTTVDAVEVHGNTAYAWGAYDQKVTPTGKATAEYKGRIITEWQRQPDGRWMVRRIMVQPG